MDKLKIGQLITEPQEKDAIHMAVAPVIAGIKLSPGQHVGIDAYGRATNQSVDGIGVVDPFLKQNVMKGETFWLFLYPGSIKSLRHEWSHPAFDATSMPDKSPSEKWMRHWAERNIEYGYSYTELSAEEKYQFALAMAEEMNVGPNEDCCDNINSEWWGHWENITGKKGQQGEYFSCGC